MLACSKVDYRGVILTPCTACDGFWGVYLAQRLHFSSLPDAKKMIDRMEAGD